MTLMAALGWIVFVIGVVWLYAFCWTHGFTKPFNPWKDQ